LDSAGAHTLPPGVEIAQNRKDYEQLLKHLALAAR